MIRIFVSHSSKDVALTTDVCQALASPNPGGAEYKAAVGLDVLADYARLQDGAPWPKQLHEWLAKSHAGLILLTKDALASDWVLKEATILTWRQSLDDSFKVFIAYDKTVVTADSLKSYRYGPLSIPTIQRIDSLDAATIVARVRQGVGSTPTVTPFEQLVQELATLMTDHVKSYTIRVLAERLRVEPPAWDPQRSGDQQYLEEIARRLLGESLGGFKGVHELIAELARTVQVEPLENILNLVAPYWVDVEAAGRLRTLAARKPPPAAALNASVPLHSGKMYVSRAFNMGRDVLVPEIAGGNAGQTAQEIAAQILRWCRARDMADESASDEEVKSALSDSLLPTYVVLPERIDPDVLDQLRREFETVIFVMSTGPRLEPDDRFADVDWLQPALDAAVEKRERASYNAAVQIINNKKGRR
jgi:hypothetical protein